MNKKYSIQVQDKSIEFDDDIDDLSEISPFRVMMDAIPVFSAYEYYAQGNFTENEKKKAEQISTNCELIIELYDELKEEILSLRKEIETTWSKYENWLQDCWKNFENRNEFLTEEVVNIVKRKYDDYRYLPLEYGMDDILEKFERSLVQNNGLLKRSKLKERMRYWLIEKVGARILRLKSLFVLDHFLSNAKAGAQSKFSSRFHKSFFSIKENENILDNNVELACHEFESMVGKIPGDRRMMALDEFINGKCSGKFRKKFGRKGPGCFAIMVNSSNQIYYALSGEKNNESKFDNACQEIENKFFAGLNAIRCKVSDNMLHYEMTQFGGFPTYVYKSFQFQGKRSVGDDAYACCERKILAYDAVRDDNIFFVRWAPCEKCRPALFNRYKKIYAFAENSKSASTYDSNKMDEYAIDLCFGFECRKVQENT